MQIKKDQGMVSNHIKDAQAKVPEAPDSFWIFFRSWILWIFLFFWTLFLGCFTIPLSFLRQERAIHFFASIWGNGFLKAIGAQIEVHGQENLQDRSSLLIVPNHQSISDIFVLYAVLKNVQFRWMAKHTLFRLPVLGWAMSGAGYIPVNRSNPKKAKESMFRAAQKVRAGKSVIIFPEGTTGNPDGSLIPFKKGAFLLAQKAGATIQPVTLIGTNRLIPVQEDRFMQRIYPTKVRVFIHPAIPPKDFTELSTTELSDKVRKIIEGPLQVSLKKDAT